MKIVSYTVQKLDPPPPRGRRVKLHILLLCVQDYPTTSLNNSGYAIHLFGRDKSEATDKLIESTFQDFVQGGSFQKCLFFYGISLFLLEEKEPHQDVARKFAHWVRVCRNLAFNIDNRATDYTKAISLIKKLFEGSLENSIGILEYLGSEQTGKQFTGLLSDQVNEEIEKAKIINDQPEWEQITMEAENNLYMKGKISFILQLSKQGNQKYSIEDFATYTKVVNRIFTTNFEYGFTIFEKLDFHRALLSKVNYMMKKSWNTYHRLPDWRSDDFVKHIAGNPQVNDAICSIFKGLKETIDEHSHDKSMLIDYLHNNYINRYDNNDSWYYIIHSPTTFKYNNHKYKDKVLLAIDNGKINLLWSTRNNIRSITAKGGWINEQIHSMRQKDLDPFKGTFFHTEPSKTFITRCRIKYRNHDFNFEIGFGPEEVKKYNLRIWLVDKGWTWIKKPLPPAALELKNEIETQMPSWAKPAETTKTIKEAEQMKANEVNFAHNLSWHIHTNFTHDNFKDKVAELCESMRKVANKFGK